MTRTVSGLILAVTMLIAPLWAGNWTEFPVSQSNDEQQNPDIDGTRIVWQQLVPDQGLDIIFVDLDSGESAIDLTSYPGQQQNAAVYGNRVVWQDLYEDNQTGESDWDIYMTDVSEPGPESRVATYIGTNQTNAAIYGDMVVWEDDEFGDIDILGADVSTFDPDVDSPLGIVRDDYDQQRPAIYNRTVVWQDNLDGGWDIWAAEIGAPNLKCVSASVYDQENPSIWGKIVAWQEKIDGDWQIWAADITNLDAPVEFPVAEAPSLQQNPDVGDNIIVWQDFRNGKDWDIYGYNLTTRREFRITDNAANQTNPAISGNLVVWQDDRLGHDNIYAARLTGPEVARCTERPAGDVNGDCVVNFGDLASIASSWMECGLDVAEACDL